MNQANRSSYSLQKIIRLSLLGLCVLLIVILLFELDPADIDTEAMDTTELDSSIELDVDLKEIIFPKVTAFNEMIERPLFNETRAPSIAEEIDPTEADPKKKNNRTRKKQEQFSLSAVVMTSEKQIAILQVGREKSLQRIALGEMIEGWSLDEVTSHSIRLKKGGETKELTLEIKGSKKKQTAKTKPDRKPARKLGTSDKTQEQGSSKEESTDEKPNTIEVSGDMPPEVQQ